MPAPADTQLRHAAHSRFDPPRAVAEAPLGATIALTVTLAVAGFALALACGALLVHPKPLPVPFNLGQKQGLETTLYVASIAVLVPLALFLVPRLARKIAAGPNGEALSVIAAALTATFAIGIVVARVLPGGGVVGLLAAVAIWTALASAALARALARRRWSAAVRASRRTGWAWTIAAIAMGAALLAFTWPRSISLPALATGAGIAALTLALRFRVKPAAWRPGRAVRVALDVVAMALLLLAIPDLVMFPPTGVSSAFLKSYETSVFQFHQNFLLGPANVVIHGGAMLVDTASQYGVASIYLLAGWFQVAPIGYGTLAFLDGALFALTFATGYCVLRLARVSRPLAAATLGVGVVVLIYNLHYSVGSLPGQHGPLRFGLPMLLVLAAVAGARWPRRRRLALAVQLAVLGLSSVWALEAFLYTVVTFAALSALASIDLDAGRRRLLARRAGMGVVAIGLTQLVFAGATLVASGQLPDYGRYLGFLRAQLVDRLGDITYDFSKWSPGLPVAVAYAASVIGLVLLVRRRRELVVAHRATVVALCGVTAYGATMFSYFVDRSADYILPYVCLPLLLAAALWLTLLGRGRLAGSSRAYAGTLAASLGLAVLLTSVAWSSVGDRFPRTPLGHLAPGGANPVTALRRLWHLPPLDPRTAAGDRLVGSYLPGTAPLLTIAAPDTETEILLRSRRRNALPFSYATEDSFASAELLPDLGRAVDALRPGRLMLTEDAALRVFAALREEPSRDPVANPIGRRFAPLQEWVLQRLGRRFDLRVVHRGLSGFVIVSLEPRR